MNLADDEQRPSTDRDRAAIAFHDGAAAQWDVRYQTGGFRRRAEFFQHEFLPLTAPAGNRWIDVGCGSGFFSRLLATQDLEVTGIDGSASMISAAAAIAARNGLLDRIRFETVNDLGRLPFPNESFSGCICLSVLEYVDEPYHCLDEMIRILRLGGLLIISIPNCRGAVRIAQKLLRRFVPSARCGNYLKYSQFATTYASFRKSLQRRGVHLVKSAAFDPLLPGVISLGPISSLLFFAGVKKETHSVMKRGACHREAPGRYLSSADARFLELGCSDAGF